MELRESRLLACLTVLLNNYFAVVNPQPRSLSSLHQAINGFWGDWSKWGSCSRPCGMSGYRMRTRVCDNPAPQNGGNPCSGPDAEMKPCYKPCAVHGQWGSWTGWKLCSVTCGNGTEVYRRLCDSPAPDYGGRNCVGLSTKLVPCSAPPCAIDGNWEAWSQWGTCSVTCGKGVEHRQRRCSNPPPQYGGHVCSGGSVEVRNCHPRECRIDGNWGAWSQWDTCSVTCGDGVRHRHRSCNNPAPHHGGHGCSGNITDTQSCHGQQCHPPQNGHWSHWSSWGDCSVTCDDGVQHRHRSCNNPRPSNGGHSCHGHRKESQNCNKDSCHLCHDKFGHDACLAVAYSGHCRDVVGYTKCPKFCRHCK